MFLTKEKITQSDKSSDGISHKNADNHKGAYLTDNRSSHSTRLKPAGDTEKISGEEPVIQKKLNSTGLPRHLKSDIENFSGYIHKEPDTKVVQRVLSLRHAHPGLISQANFGELVQSVNEYNNNPDTELLSRIKLLLQPFEPLADAFYQDMMRQIDEEKPDDINFEQKKLLGEEACYGLSLTWIQERAVSAAASNRKLRAADKDPALGEQGSRLQSEYITNKFGQGPILDYLNTHLADLKKNHVLPSGHLAGKEADKPLSHKDVWEKEALYAARRRKHLEGGMAGGIKRIPVTIAFHNFAPASFGSILTQTKDFLAQVQRFVIIVLEGANGGHAIALQKVNSGYVYFDPDLGQRGAGSLSAVAERIAQVNEILVLNSIQFELFL
jgi:hypothetical protein